MVEAVGVSGSVAVVSTPATVLFMPTMMRRRTLPFDSVSTTTRTLMRTRVLLERILELGRLREELQHLFSPTSRSSNKTQLKRLKDTLWKHLRRRHRPNSNKTLRRPLLPKWPSFPQRLSQVCRLGLQLFQTRSSMPLSNYRALMRLRMGLLSFLRTPPILLPQPSLLHSHSSQHLSRGSCITRPRRSNPFTTLYTPALRLTGSSSIA